MQYPLISEYISAIKDAEDNFATLTNLRPVLDLSGNPVMSSGNFAVVFKMKDISDGKFYAVKCFIREQEGRNEAYRLISDELQYVSSNYIAKIKYLDNELFVDTNQSVDNEFPILLMDWIEGKTLDRYIKDNIDNYLNIYNLFYSFCHLCKWMMSQAFAHGDIKPDNIIVNEYGGITLVDYDGMYVPTMKGQQAREIGSPDFRHPQRTINDFDEHIDDLSLVSLLLTLSVALEDNNMFKRLSCEDACILHEKDHINIACSELYKALHTLFHIPHFSRIFSLYNIVLAEKTIDKNVFDVLLKELLQTAEYKYACRICNGKDKNIINKREAFLIFDKLSNNGYRNAKMCLSCCYKYGYGCAKNTKHSKAILEDPIFSDDFRGRIENYGYNCENEVVFMAKETDSDEVQNVAAQYNPGNCYAKAKGLEENYEKANGHEYVDLGLPSGLKWATCNVGANSPEEYGDYYAWGETETKDEYTEANCTTYGKTMNDIAGNAQYDVARRKWGGSWRMPTEAEMEELEDNCIWTWTIQNDVEGYKVTGRNGNHIFLPAAGSRYGLSLYFAGSRCYYWVSTPYDYNYNYNDNCAYGIGFGSSDHGMGFDTRDGGHSVRPVIE